ncbi:MAG: type II toxin-antitoxin system ParD family antitoxin [Dongiaceae bacterium]
MPRRNISLTAEQDAFIDEVVERGEYGNASEAVGDAILALQERRADEALRLEKLRLAVQQGVAAIERGDFTDLEDDELEAWLADLGGLPSR